MNDFLYSAHMPVICYTLLGLMVAVGVLIYRSAISHAHVHKCAVSELLKVVRENGQSEQNHIAKKLLNNMTSDKVVFDVEAVIDNGWFNKESAERNLSPKQQLVLMNRLLGLKTNVRQAAKIVRARTTRDVVRLAVRAATSGDIKTAPMALFH